MIDLPPLREATASAVNVFPRPGESARIMPLNLDFDASTAAPAASAW
jgi:hypothetical protein